MTLTSGMPQGMFGGWQLPQMQPIQQHAPSLAEQNARIALAQQPQQQMPMALTNGGISDPGNRYSGIANAIGQAIAPAAQTSVTVPGVGTPYAPANGAFPSSVQPYTPPSQVQIGMPQIPGLGQSILGRLLGS